MEGRYEQLPPGFRFQPTDQEMIVCYLKKKVAGTATSVTSIIADVDIYKFDPWELPGKAIVSGDGEWFFFSPRDRKYPNGGRPNRTAGCGYWKATGTDKPVLAGGGARCLGVKKALVFYQGRSPKGRKTEWVMHEYRLLDHQISRSKESMRLDDWVLCRVRNKALVFYDSSDLQPMPTICNTADEIIIGREQQLLVPSNEAFAGGGIEHWNDDDHQADLIGGGGSATASSSTAAQAGAHLVLESIKRKLSFHAIDELYLLHPTKRIISGTEDDRHMSPMSFLLRSL